MMEKEDRSLWLILAGIVVFSLWYTLSKRTENALWLLLAAICGLILAYRLYGGFVAARAAVLSDAEAGKTPDHLPTGRWALVGYQFASIASSGVLVGPVLAAQFGYLPGFLWILIGAVLGGAVHDLVVLAASRRRNGAFLPLLAAEALGPWAGLAAWGITLIGLFVFLGLTGSFLADLLAGNVWGLYILAVTIVVALLASLYEMWLRPGKVGEAVALGVVLALAALAVGTRLARQPVTGLLASRGLVVVLIALYCLISGLLPLRVLGRARVAISGYLSIAVLLVLAAGVAFGAPSLRQPAVSQYTSGNGPLLTGGAIPYLMVIITSGAICGFNALAGTAITSRLLKRESDALPVGYGSLALQALLVCTVLILVSTLWRWDFYGMTTNLTLGEVERVAGAQQHVWDELRGTLQADSIRFPGGPTNETRADNIRSPLGVTAIAASASWALRDVPGFRRDWLPSVYRLMFVLQALLLFGAVEAAARVGRVAAEEATRVALRTPALSATGRDPKTAMGLTAVVTAVITLVWAVLAAKSDVMTLLPFAGFVSLLLAAVGLGLALVTLRSNARWHALLVAIPLAVVVLLVIAVGAATLADAARYLNSRQAVERAYATLPAWGQQVRFVNTERAREVVQQWPAKDVSALHAERGQAELGRQIQSRLGVSEAEGSALAAIISRRASALSLWSWLQIILTILLSLLAVVVAVGRFVRVPLRWPARSIAVPAAPPTGLPKPATALPPEESGDFEI